MSRAQDNGALLIICNSSSLCGITNLMLYFTVEKDEEKVRLSLTENVESESREGYEHDEGRESLEFT